jgi:MHS family shikimate/dehydroshikimate transporter-like MFS transporter
MTLTPMPADPLVGADLARNRRRALWSAMFGTLIEYYDFFLYSLLAAVALGPLFFPRADPTVGLIASFATLAVGWFARPVGALMMSVIGDRVGRRNVLVITALAMGVASVLIGLLPTYATIGIWAPVLLVVLRIVQGLAAGGEFGGGLLMSVEYAEPDRRGRASAAPQLGLYGGIILANAGLLLVSLLPREQFLSWGWRLPFLASAVLVFITVRLRTRVEETPVFEAEKKAKRLAERPLGEMFRTQWRPLLVLIVVMLIVTTGSAFYTSFLPAYAIQRGFSASVALSMSLVGTTIGIVLAPLAAALSDRFGRRRVTSVGIAFIPVMAWAAFAAVGMGTVGFAVLAGALSVLAHAVAFGTATVWVSEFFPTRYRYSGTSIGYQVASALGAGIFPLAAAALMAAAGGPPHYAPVVVYLVVLAVISLVSVRFARETARVSFSELDDPEAPALVNPQATDRSVQPGRPTRQVTGD